VLLQQTGKMLLIALTVALGVSLATAMLDVVFGIGDKVNRELKTYGANINVVPRGASLLDDLYGIESNDDLAGASIEEADITKVKTIFWAFNIIDFAPYLTVPVALNTTPDNTLGPGPSVQNYTTPTTPDLQDNTVGPGPSVQIDPRDNTVGPGPTVLLDTRLVGTWFSKHMTLSTGEEIDTGMRALKSWWDVEGQWAGDEQPDSAMVGSLLAENRGINVGDRITVSTSGATQSLQVVGIFSAGGDEDEWLYVPLATAQALGNNTAGKVSTIEVSALTTPDNELSRRAAANPNSLTKKEWETWYCTAYVSSICYQIDEVIPSAVAKPVRQVAESEGVILEKTQLLMLLITALSLLGVILGISNLVTTSVMERSVEIGLLKAVGATDRAIVALVVTELLLIGALGGAVGYFAGIGFAQIIAHTVFGSGIELSPLVIPLVAVLVVLVTLAGSVPAIRMLLSLRPAEVLHGR
jgi:putative ABC transport system permease protein